MTQKKTREPKRGRESKLTIAGSIHVLPVEETLSLINNQVEKVT